MDKKEQVMEVATQLFAERGYENTPLALICERAAVSKGLIFHHFKSKDHLLREIFSKTTELIVEINRPTRTDRPARERLLELIEAFFKQLESDRLFFQLNLNIMLQPGTRALLNDLIKERAAFILESVRSIFSELSPGNCLPASYHFIAELDGIALNYLCIFDDYPLHEIKAQILAKYTQA